VEHLFVHGGLETLIESLGFGGDIVGGDQLRFDRNGRLVRRVTGEAEAFRIIGDEFDGHDVRGLVVRLRFETKKPGGTAGPSCVR
jgi:hypothetical protein